VAMKSQVCAAAYEDHNAKQKRQRISHVLPTDSYGKDKRAKARSVVAAAHERSTVAPMSQVPTRRKVCAAIRNNHTGK